MNGNVREAAFGQYAFQLLARIYGHFAHSAFPFSAFRGHSAALVADQKHPVRAKNVMDLFKAGGKMVPEINRFERRYKIEPVVFEGQFPHIGAEHGTASVFNGAAICLAGPFCAKFRLVDAVNLCRRIFPKKCAYCRPATAAAIGNHTKILFRKKSEPPRGKPLVSEIHRRKHSSAAEAPGLCRIFNKGHSVFSSFLYHLFITLYRLSDAGVALFVCS